MEILVLNGPNLNLLGTREPDIYGVHTLDDIRQLCLARGCELGIDVAFFQSNTEGALIDAVQDARVSCRGIVVNPAGYGHTSVALLDALKAVALPFVEVHLSNIFAREAYRHHSYLSSDAMAVISGCGVKGYLFALDLLAERLKT